MRDAKRVLAIRLDGHRLEGGADVPGLEQLDRKIDCLHRSVKPLRQRSGLQADTVVDACVVNDHVNAAKLLQYRFHRLLAGVHVREIGL